jgi:hypothetical protein
MGLSVILVSGLPARKTWSELVTSDPLYSLAAQRI